MRPNVRKPTLNSSVSLFWNSFLLPLKMAEKNISPPDIKKAIQKLTIPPIKVSVGIHSKREAGKSL